MTPYFHDDHFTVYQGDCREVMAAMEPESVHCVVTSPPYWGLRDYGIGEKGIGLEPTPEAFVANMVDVFRAVKRVLRKDGTLWLNLGDSYVGADRADGTRSGPTDNTSWTKRQQRTTLDTSAATGLPPKNLVGIPWRVAFALQADGWYLRSDIIWAKPNPMPESVTDRPTKAHEYLFLLTKSARYYYDADAVREAHRDPNVVDGVYQNPKAVARPGYVANTQGWVGNDGKPGGLVTTHRDYNPAGRNLRSVWTIATEPYPGAHFATFPRKLVEPCVKAGTSERGVCPECGAPWTRETDVELVPTKKASHTFIVDKRDYEADKNDQGSNRTKDGHKSGHINQVTTIGWRPSCAHDAEPVAAAVLDPFAGSGTTGMVAQSLGRRAVLIDLNGDYLVQAMARNAQTPLGMIG